MHASRFLIRAAPPGLTVTAARFTTGSSSASQPSPSAPQQPTIKSTFVTVSNGGIVPISKEQYLQLNTRPKRTSKEAMAFSAVLLAALATGGGYLYQNWDEEPVRSKREVAVAHSGAAWARLKDAFTLSSADTPVVLEDAGSLGHKVKVGWNNGVRSFRDAVRGLFEN